MKHIDSLKLTIIIPVVPYDESWQSVLQQLAAFALDHFWILSVSDEGHDCEGDDFKEALMYHHSLAVVSGAQGRSEQINRAILTAKTDWIWVLNPNATLSQLTVTKLMNSLLQNPEALHYFEARAEHDAWPHRSGQRPRPCQFPSPFRELGLAFHRRLWQTVGGLPRDLSYGEDHVFVWRLKQSGFYLAPVIIVIRNCPIKFKTGGWMHTTRRLVRNRKNRRQRWPRLPLRKC